MAYFFELTSEQEALLKRTIRRGIRRMTIDDAVGFLVEDDAVLSRVFSCLRVQVREETDTKYERIKRIHLVSSQPKVMSGEYARWNGCGEETFIQITREVLLPVVQKEIALDVPHGERQEPILDGRFHIWIWSGSFGGKTNSCASELFGISVDCKDNSYPYSYTGIPIADECGTIAGEIIGENLYIFHDVCHYGVRREASLYRAILEKSVSLLSLSARALKREMGKFLEILQRESRGLYIASCVGDGRREKERLQKAVHSEEEKIRECRVELVKHIRARELLNRSLAKWEGGEREDGQEERYGSDFDKIVALPKVKRIAVTGQTVTVLTTVLCCRNPETEVLHEIGAFRIVIHAEAEDSSIQWFNLTRKVNDCMHPHINEDGDACLGTLEEALPDLIGMHRYLEVVMLAIAFVESVNPDDAAGSSIVEWPRARGKVL